MQYWNINSKKKKGVRHNYKLTWLKNKIKNSRVENKIGVLFCYIGILIAKKKKKKALDTITNLAGIRNPKTENPRPKSFFFVSTPIWPDAYLLKKKKKKSLTQTQLGNTIEVCKRIHRKPKIENPRLKSFSLVTTPIWDNLFPATVSDQNPAL